jgi:hypothetical protein
VRRCPSPITVICLAGVALALGACSGEADPPAPPAPDGGPDAAADTRPPDAGKPVPCNSACTGVCQGLCVGVCSERDQDGECVAPCEGTCIGSCYGICAKSAGGKVDAGGGDRRPVWGDSGANAPAEAPAPAPGTWTDQTHASTASWPPLDQTGAMVFDRRRMRVVMFGGVGERSNNTWEWDGHSATWTLMQQLGGTRPSARTGHAMVYDSTRGLVVIHGGIDASGASNNETWEWDGEHEAWTQRVPGPIPSRWGHAMTYDESTGLVVLFGGAHRDPMLGDGELLDTWEYDPAADKWANWTYPLPGIWPRPRKGHAMVYDSSRKLTVMYGGEVANLGPSSDLWEWSTIYHAWREVMPSPGSGSPGGRVYASLVYIGGGQMLLFGREGPPFVRWNAVKGLWQSLSTPVPAVFPPPRARSAAAWDTSLGVLVVVGGAVAQGRGTLTDTWLWRP